MKILFTKKNLNKKKISEKIGSIHEYDCLDFISIIPKKVKPFPLKGASVIFSSTNAVDSFFENGFKLIEKINHPNFNKVYCVGRKTKQRLREFGYGTYKVKKHAKDLERFLIENASNEKFIHFCGNLSLDIIQKTDFTEDIIYQKKEIYDTILNFIKINKDYDALVFFSPSAVRSYSENNSLEGKKIFSLGNTTTQELTKITQQKIITSQESNLDDLLELILQND